MADALTDRTEIPACPQCGGRRVSHRGEFGRDGEPEAAWFECRACEHQWSDFTLSARLLGIDDGDEPCPTT